MVTAGPVPAGTYPDGVKEFWIYTGLRIVLFLASLALVIGVWMMVADEAQHPVGGRDRVRGLRGWRRTSC